MNPIRLRFALCLVFASCSFLAFASDEGVAAIERFAEQINAADLSEQEFIPPFDGNGKGRLVRGSLEGQVRKVFLYRQMDGRRGSMVEAFFVGDGTLVLAAAYDIRRSDPVDGDAAAWVVSEHRFYVEGGKLLRAIIHYYQTPEDPLDAGAGALAAARNSAESEIIELSRKVESDLLRNISILRTAAIDFVPTVSDRIGLQLSLAALEQEDEL